MRFAQHSDLVGVAPDGFSSAASTEIRLVSPERTSPSVQSKTLIVS
jgi:hypothetical protein